MLVGFQNSPGIPAAGGAFCRHRAGIAFAHADRPETSRNRDGAFRIAIRGAQQLAVGAQPANISRRGADRHIAAAGQRQFRDPGWMIRFEAYHGSAGPQGAYPVGGSGDGDKIARRRRAFLIGIISAALQPAFRPRRASVPQLHRQTRRRGRAAFIITPASGGTVGPQGAGVPSARGDGCESARRRSGLALAVPSPA